MKLEASFPSSEKGATCMSPATGLSKKQLMVLAIILVFLLITAVFVIHTALPGILHMFAVTPFVPYGHP